MTAISDGQSGELQFDNMFSNHYIEIKLSELNLSL